MDHSAGTSQSRIATVLGSTSVPASSQAYALAIELGRSLAHSGFVIATREGGGVLEACQRGVRSVNGHTLVIGTRTEDLGSPTFSGVRRVPVKDTLECSHRLYELASMLVVLAGDLETLGDLAYAWNKNKITREVKPIFLIGGGWERIVSILKKSDFDQ